MNRPRSQHTATLLRDGRVLLAGGTDGAGALPTLEIYDPGWQATFLAPVTLQTPRQNHTATLFYRGGVLLVGGANASGVVGSAELYNPDTGALTQAGSLSIPRTLASAARLLDGSVLVADGQDAQSQDLYTAELYSPAANAFTPLAAVMSTGRSGHVGLRLLHNGKVLLAGGRMPADSSPL